MLGALLADRAEEEAGEATPPAAPYDEEVGVAGGLEQDVRRFSLDRLPRQLEPR